MKIEKKNTDVWYGKYKGVDFEINKFESHEGKDSWTYYISLWLDRIPEKYNPDGFWLEGKKDRSYVHYDYFSHNVINSIEFHHGCTYYSKESGFDGSPKIIKIGCDYQHYWDEGKSYDLNTLTRDVMNTIDAFIRLIPGYKYWCRGNGKLYDLKNGIVKDGSFYSKEYFGDKDWFKEYTK